MAQVLIGLGSNLGNRAARLEQALARLDADARIDHLAASGWYESSAVGGPEDQPPFLNAAAAFETDLEPHELLDRLQSIEALAGRLRNEHWGPRTLDLDLLIYDDFVISTPLLTVPHPLMAFRRFVLEPAREVAADFVHPLTGWTIARHGDHLDRGVPLVAIEGPRMEDRLAFVQRLAARLGSARLQPPVAWHDLAERPAPPAAEVAALCQQALAMLDRALESHTLAVADWSPRRFVRILAEAPGGDVTLRAECAALCARLPHPQITVWLAPPVPRRAAAGRQHLPYEGFIALRDWGPVLYCPAEAGWDHALEVACTAIAGMQQPVVTVG